MGQPIATKKAGFIAFAFPDVCNTQVGPATVPIPYPNIGQLSDATNISDGSNGNPVYAVGNPVILVNTSEIPTTTGDEAGALGGVTSGTTKGKVEFTQGSSSVFVNNKAVVRMFDPTKQNNGNAVGTVMGGEPTVLVG